jgi:branched-chain amino acid transport system permease protein
MIRSAIGVCFDGVAYGSLLFLISVGLSVTMGLMNIINLAHGAFAMFGGYLTLGLMNRAGVPFLWTLPLVFASSAAAGLALEPVLYRRLYRASHLDQVLLTIGLVFVSMAIASYVWGPATQSIALPAFLTGQVRLFGLDVGSYRLFLIGLIVAITAGLRRLLARTRFGAQVRAAVDNRDVAAGVGIPVDRLFPIAFALGSGLAGLGGALGIEVLGLDPTFPLKYMVYFLVVVTVGGPGTITGAAVASLGLGLLDVVGKYYFPAVGAFLIYASMVLFLVLFPAGVSGKRA